MLTQVIIFYSNTSIIQNKTQYSDHQSQYLFLKIGMLKILKNLPDIQSFPCSFSSWATDHADIPVRWREEFSS
jgi:hypothetical protein